MISIINFNTETTEGTENIKSRFSVPSVVSVSNKHRFLGLDGSMRTVKKSRFRGSLFPGNLNINQSNACPGFLPIAFRIFASGQKPVNADCNRLAPTNTVNHIQFGLWY